MDDNYFMGLDGFVWFTGVVEDRNDPAQLGRVRVRCLGLHTEDKNEIPTEALPWAHIMHPITDPSMSGMGNTPSFMVEGTWVVGFFRDIQDKQQPIVMGTLPGFSESLGDPNKGFNDPNRRSYDNTKEEYNQSVYPKNIGESDVNTLARNFDKENSIIGLKDATRILNIPAADGTSWNESPSTYNSVYPKNHVFESEAGHIVEYDDTPGYQRLHEYSSSGTFYEIDKIGNKHTRVEANNTEVVKGTEFKFVGEDCNLTVAGTLNIKCNALNIEVTEDYTEEVDGDRIIRIKGTKSTDITGIISESFGDNYTRSIKGSVDERYGSTIVRTMSGIVTNNHDANILNYITGDLEFHTSTAINIFSGTTIDIDASEHVKIDSAAVNLNNGAKGAARVDDPADTGDAGTGGNTDSNAAGTDKINSGSTTVFIGTTAPEYVGNRLTEPTLLELLEVTEPDINILEPAATTPGGGITDPKDEETGSSLSPLEYGGPFVGGTSTKSAGSVLSVNYNPSGENISGIPDQVFGTKFATSSDNVASVEEERFVTYVEPAGCKRKDIGKISEKYESNGNPGAIGYDRTGGYSYGSYQIASKVGSMKNFISFLKNESNGYIQFYTQLQTSGGDAAARRGTDAFKKKWKELGQNSSFSQAQHDFIQRTHYDPAVTKIKIQTGVDICGKPHSVGLQDAIWSSAVQHGPNGAVNIFKRAIERLHKIKIEEATKSKKILPTLEETISAATDVEIITEIYNEKLKKVGGNLAYFKSSKKSIQASVSKRFNAEKSDALSLA